MLAFDIFFLVHCLSCLNLVRCVLQLFQFPIVSSSFYCVLFSLFVLRVLCLHFPLVCFLLYCCRLFRCHSQSVLSINVSFLIVGSVSAQQSVGCLNMFVFVDEYHGLGYVELFFIIAAPSSFLFFLLYPACTCLALFINVFCSVFPFSNIVVLLF